MTKQTNKTAYGWKHSENISFIDSFYFFDQIFCIQSFIFLFIVLKLQKTFHFCSFTALSLPQYMHYSSRFQLTSTKHSNNSKYIMIQIQYIRFLWFNLSRLRVKLLFSTAIELKLTENISLRIFQTFIIVLLCLDLTKEPHQAENTTGFKFKSKSMEWTLSWSCEGLPGLSTCFPPYTRVAPSFTPMSQYSSSLSRWALWFWGPWSVERSRGSPIFIFLISSTCACQCLNKSAFGVSNYFWKMNIIIK